VLLLLLWCHRYHCCCHLASSLALHAACHCCRHWRHPLHCMRLAALPVDCCPFSDFFCSPCNIHCCCRCHQCSGDSSQFATTAQLPLPVCFIFMAVPMHCSCFGFCLAMPQGLLLMPVDCCLSKQQKLIFLGCSNAPAATITCVAATATTNSEP